MQYICSYKTHNPHNMHHYRIQQLIYPKKFSNAWETDEIQMRHADDVRSPFKNKFPTPRVRIANPALKTYPPHRSMWNTMERSLRMLFPRTRQFNVAVNKFADITGNCKNLNYKLSDTIILVLFSFSATKMTIQCGSRNCGTLARLSFRTLADLSSKNMKWDKDT